MSASFAALSMSAGTYRAALTRQVLRTLYTAHTLGEAQDEERCMVPPGIMSLGEMWPTAWAHAERV